VAVLVLREAAEASGLDFAVRQDLVAAVRACLEARDDLVRLDAFAVAIGPVGAVIGRSPEPDRREPGIVVPLAPLLAALRDQAFA
jgi:hypothetical protein